MRSTWVQHPSRRIDKTLERKLWENENRQAFSLGLQWLVSLIYKVGRDPSLPSVWSLFCKFLGISFATAPQFGYQLNFLKCSFPSLGTYLVS